MARTYAVVELDNDAKPKGWEVVLSALEEIRMLRKLRKGGFYGGFATIEELKADCVRLAPLSSTALASETAVGSSNEKSMESPRPKVVNKKNPATGNHLAKQASYENSKAGMITSPLSSMPPADIVIQNQLGEAQKKKQTDDHNTSETIGLNLKTSAVRSSIQDHEPSHMPIVATLNKPEGPLMDTIPLLEPGKHLNMGTISGEGCAGSSFDMRIKKDNPIQLCSNAKTSGRLNGSGDATDGEAAPFTENGISDININSRQMPVNLRTGVHSRSWTQSRASGSGESDTDSDGQPISFKRARKQTAGKFQLASTAGITDMEIGRVHAFSKVAKEGLTNTSSIDDWDRSADCNKLITSRTISSQCFSDSDPDSEPLILKRAMSGRRKLVSPGISNELLRGGPVRVPDDTDDVDHVTLKSRMCKLIAQRKNTFRAVEMAICPETVSCELNHISMQTSDRDACMFLDKGGTGTRENSTSCRQQQLSQAVQIIEPLGKGTCTSVSCEHSLSRDHCLEIHDYSAGISTINEEEIKCRLRNLIKESHQDIRTQHNIIESKCTVAPLTTLVNLSSITSAAKLALSCLESGGSFVDAEAIFPKRFVRVFDKYKTELNEYAVDQYLPSINKQREVAEKINCYVQDGDMVVEVSGWTSDFFSLLKERLSKSGKKFGYKKFVLSNSNKVESLEEWFSKEKKGLPTGSNLVMCFSPSFELRGQQIKQLFGHALQLKPKLVGLIAPLLTQRLEEERNYELVWEDQNLLKGEVLWPWGLMDIPDSAFDQRSGISPSIYLWSRSDWAMKHRQVAYRFSHIPKQGHENKVQSPTLQSIVMSSGKKECLESNLGGGVFYDNLQPNEFSRPLLSDNFSNIHVHSGCRVLVENSDPQYDETMKDPEEDCSNCHTKLYYNSNILDASRIVMC